MLLKINGIKNYSKEEIEGVDFITFSELKNKEVLFILENDIVQNFNFEENHRKETQIIKKEYATFPTKFIVDYMNAIGSNKINKESYQNLSEYIIEKYPIVSVPFDFFIGDE